ncbi:MAG: hypothetical protein AAFX99_19195 [Myxococcota bacterium]
MSDVHTVVMLGAFVCMILAFSVLQLWVARRPRHTLDEHHRASQLEMAQFRDAVMARVEERMAHMGLKVRLQPLDRLSFELTPYDQEEGGIVVVLLNLYDGCTHDPERAETFQAHFVEDLMRTVRTTL